MGKRTTGNTKRTHGFYYNKVWKVSRYGFRFPITTKLTKIILVKFCVLSKKNNYNYLKKLLNYSLLSQLCICVKVDFLYILQSKQHVADWRQKQIWSSNCLLLSQTLNVIQCYSFCQTFSILKNIIISLNIFMLTYKEFIGIILKWIKEEMFLKWP